MTQVRFQRVDRVAGEDYPAATVTDVTQAVAPPNGPHRDFLVERGYPYEGDEFAAYRTTRMSRTKFALDDAGILDDLDWLFVATGFDMTTSVQNWVPGQPDTTSFGTDMTGGVFVTNGVDDQIKFDVAANAVNYALNDACAFVYLSETPPADLATDPIIGGTSDDVTRLNRNAGSPFANTRMNGSPSVIVSPIVEDSDWGPGLWTIERTSSTNIAVRKNGIILGSNDASPSVALPAGLAVGRNNDIYTAQSFSAFGGGKALTGDKQVLLAEILAEHTAEMKALAAL